MAKLKINSVKHGSVEVLVDAVQLKRLKKHTWSVTKIGINLYSLTSVIKDGKYSKMYMHRFITNAPSGFVVDHINHNTLDNRKNNLRVCTTSINSLNNSRKTKCGFANVNKVKNRYRAMIHVNGKAMHGGYFNTAEEAFDKAVSMKQKIYSEFKELANG